MKKDRTDLTVVQDRSGSMFRIQRDVIGGYNSFVKDQKDAPGECYLTLVQFDFVHNEEPLQWTYKALDIREVPPLNVKSYVPRGDTPLLYALGKTIDETGARLSMIPEDEKPENVICLVMTDGEENASGQLDKEGRYTKAKVAEMVKHQEEVYKWKFIFIGADIDAFAEAGGMGIYRGTTIETVHANYAATMDFAGSNIKTYRKTGRKEDLEFTKAQREKAAKK